MKLAEALNARKELEARLTRLEERLHASARVQEGVEPDESPDALYAMLEKAAAALVEIVSRISRTNAKPLSRAASSPTGSPNATSPGDACACSKAPSGPPPRPTTATGVPARSGR